MVNGLSHGFKPTTYRTHVAATVAALTPGARVTLSGWAHKCRDLGQLVFIDLRDRSGITQCVFDSSDNPTLVEQAAKIKLEWVIQVTGVIRLRQQANPELATGHLEVVVSELAVLTMAKTPPIGISDDQAADESLRLKYRYLDLRKPVQFERFWLRHRLSCAAREYLNGLGFLDVETPMLTKSTPEGARDYLVPSRVHPGEFFALPQSPQLFKQLLMVSGFEKYYQIVKCFRDEDLRADRQPEFTQIDIEASFVTQEDVISMIEGLIHVLFETAGQSVSLPIPRIHYDDAMGRYGSDRPDLRYDLAFFDITDVCESVEFQVFRSISQSKGLIKGICVPNGQEKLTRKQLDSLTELVKPKGISGLAWMHIKEGEIASPIAKFLSASDLEAIVSRAGAKVGDTLLLIGHLEAKRVVEALGVVRESVADLFELKTGHSLVWVTDFPLFEQTDTGDLTSVHHPFTAPYPDQLALLKTDPLKVKSQAYDIVYNGVELGGGSIRIHDPLVQRQIFELLQLTDADIQAKFGFFVDALQYGTPPHGGIALGLDRVVMMLANAKSIRDVIAFPKTQNATCLLTQAPSPVTEAQLHDLHIQSASNSELPKSADSATNASHV